MAHVYLFARPSARPSPSHAPGRRRERLDDAIVPVPADARGQLISLRAAESGEFLSVLGQSAVELRRLTEPGFSNRRRGGSDAANAATFRAVPRANGEVALEAFALPGRFVAPSAAGALRLEVPRRGSSPHGWRLHALAGSRLRLEPAGWPGWFIGAVSGPAGANSAPRAAERLALVNGTAQALELEKRPSAAEYPPCSFWARGARGQGVLMWPLNEMVDETYTVYWRFCGVDGCPKIEACRTIPAQFCARASLTAACTGATQMGARGRLPSGGL